MQAGLKIIMRERKEQFKSYCREHQIEPDEDISLILKSTALTAICCAVTA